MIDHTGEPDTCPACAEARANPQRLHMAHPWPRYVRRERPAVRWHWHLAYDALLVALCVILLAILGFIVLLVTP